MSEPARFSSVRWAERTSPEIAAAADRQALALIPLGCTEQHALHLPVDTDTFQVEQLAWRGAALAAELGAEVLVLPTLPFGPASEHQGFAGTITIDSATYIQVIRDIIASVLDSGFHRVAVLHGCGGHWVVPGALWDAKAHASRSGHELLLRHVSFDSEWQQLQREVFPESGDTSAGHAGIMETALCLASRPELVRLDQNLTPTVDRLEERYHKRGEVFLFAELSDTGGLGDAVGASAEGGAKLWAMQTEWLAGLFADLASADDVSLGAQQPA